MSDNFAYDVFLSHNSKDKARVRRIAKRLRDAGLRVWFDQGDIDAGLKESRVLVLCVSANALASGWVPLERSTAIHRDPANEGRRFIPLLLSDCELPDTLQRYKYVDLRTDDDEAFKELILACQPEPLTTSPGSTEGKKAETSLRVDTTTPEESVVVPVATLKHTATDDSWVHCVAISPDGKWAVSGCWDSTLKLWDLTTNKSRATMKGHTGIVNSVAITPDGKQIISTSNDHTVRVWDARSGREISVLEGHENVVWNVVALPGGKALSISGDGTLRRWDLASRSCIQKIRFSPRSVDDGRSLAVYGNETRAISGHENGELRVWDIPAGKCISTFKGHSNAVTGVQVSPDEQFAVSGSDDGTVKIWDLEKGSIVGTLEGHRDSVFSVAITSDGNVVASAGFTDKTVRLWDWRSASTIEVLTLDHATYPLSLAISGNNRTLLVGTTQGTIGVYRLPALKPRQSVQPPRRYINAKVVLLGEGTVGKTSLAHRLVEDKYVVLDRTHGMNVWPLPLPLTQDATMEREALLWDLAGQEDYRLIHQLFLDETALALLLVNPQKDDPFAEAGDWLKALKAVSGQTDSGREIPRLLIFSQVDVGRMKLGDTKIERFRTQYGFADWMATSAKTGENCSDSGNQGEASELKQLIAKSIPWDQLPWTSTPRVLAELKNAMISMRDKADIRLVRFAELMQRLEQQLPEEKFGESDVRTAVTLLANQGLARMLKFGDLVLLQPELLNGYAGAIIRAARKHTDEIGAVLEADIYKPEFDFTGVERLKHRADEELLLRALVQTFLDHSLCIAEDTPQGRHLVFPSQYRREKDIPHDPDIFVSYTFSGEWQTVWTTLVVRLWYSQEFAHKELWRNAAEFASPKGFTLGLKINNKQGEGTATVSLYFDKEVTDELKAIFIEYVHRHLAKYGCEVTRDRRYLCAECGNSVKDLEAVRKRLQLRKEFITCQTCDEKVPLIDFIEQRLKSDPVARKILAMDQAATHELDTQALEQILIGHMMATCGEANQIFRPLTMFDYGIDGEVEFKDDNGKASGKRIYIQLKSGNSYLRKRKRDGTEIFDVKDERHLEYWTSQPVDVYLVIRQTDEFTGAQTIRWMNVTRYLNDRNDKKNRQIVFTGEKLDMEAVWKVRDQFFPAKVQRRK